MTTKLLPYQLQTIRRIEQFNGRCILALDMGLGKSACSLWWAKHNLNQWPIVIVCPAYLKWNWQNECRKHINLYAEILSGMKPPERRIGPRRKIYIVNYDILGPNKRGVGWLDFLKELNPALVIADESHFLKNTRSTRYKNMKVFCRKIPHILCLSGTPLVNRPAELWPALNLTRPDLFPKFLTYADRYCNARFTRWGMVYDGAANLPELHRIITETCTIRYRKNDVLKDLPAKTRHVIPIEITNKKEYQEAQHSFIKWLLRLDPGKARKARNAEELVKMNYLKHLAGRLKLRPVVEWISDYLEESEGKLLVFGHHIDVLDELENKFPDITVRVDGSIVGKKRQLYFDQFNKDKSKRLFLGNVDAAGTGWSCNSASTVAFVELPWTPGQCNQAEDRIHGLRRGVKGKKVQVFYLVAKDTIEEKLCKILQAKQKTLDSVLDGKKLDDSLNILNQLKLELLREKRL